MCLCGNAWLEQSKCVFKVRVAKGQCRSYLQSKFIGG
jgi:hypothetical protein